MSAPASAPSSTSSSASSSAVADSSSSSSVGVSVGASAKRTPSDFLRSVLGRQVIVKLNSGVCYNGVLACLDGYMNAALEQTEEYVDGQLKAKYGDTFIRGNNILYISTQKKKTKAK